MEIINRLIRYVKGHFEREELLMAEYKYPGLAKHRKQHQDFVRLIYAIRRIQTECPEKIDPRKLLAITEGWLKQHILKSDRDYISSLKGDFGRRKSDAVDEPSGEAEAKANDSSIEEIVVLSVEVPSSAVAIIRRCARLLRMGGAGAESLAGLADPITSMTSEEALTIGKVVLRN